MSVAREDKNANKETLKEQTNSVTGANLKTDVNDHNSKKPLLSFPNNLTSSNNAISEFSRQEKQKNAKQFQSDQKRGIN